MGVIAMSEVYAADAGGTQVLHTLATSDDRLTAREVADELDADVSQVRKTLSHLSQGGYVTRVKRGGGVGRNPYEYDVYQPENDA